MNAEKINKIIKKLDENNINYFNEYIGFLEENDIDIERRINISMISERELYACVLRRISSRYDVNYLISKLSLAEFRDLNQVSEICEDHIEKMKTL